MTTTQPAVDTDGVPTNLSEVEQDLIARSLHYARLREQCAGDPYSVLNGSIGATELPKP